MQTQKKTERTGKIKIALVVLCFAAVVCGIGVIIGRTATRVMYPLKYTELVEQYAAEYDVPPAMIYAVIHTESGFRPDAESDAGARGLMQMLPDTLDWLQTKTGEHHDADALYDPEISIRYGVYFLHILREQYGNDTAVFAAYHAGINRVREWLKDETLSSDGETLDHIPYADTRHYVNKVKKTQNVYRNFYDQEG